MSPLQDWPVQVEYDPKNMVFRRLGPSGLRVPVFSLGGWLTLGGSLKGDPVKDIVKTAFEAGINMIDTAETYADGKSEEEIGRVIRELGLRRTDLVITTKIFWGVGRKGPNDGGLSRKHIIEGTRESLARLGLSYVDVIFAHRHDHNVPMEEIVRAFNYVIDQGWAHYWGTSEWTAREIEEAHHIATKLHLASPVAEQCQHNMFVRERPEKEYLHLYKKYQISTTVFSALHFGLLTGKYNNGIPEGTRLAEHGKQFDFLIKELETPAGQEKIRKLKELTKLAEEELQTTLPALSLAWVAKNPNTSTVILGASKPEQLLENLKALDVIPKLTPEILHKIDKILDNAPEAHREFDPKNMPFRRLGPSGLRVPVFSLGGWLTLGGTVVGDPVKEIIKTAFENGINMFDTAEAYAAGKSEEEIGRVIRELGLRRTDLVITTKLFWGLRKGPNDGGLSRKHIIEGTQESLARLGLDYVDVIFAHRHDHTVPMEEIVRAFNYVIEKGWALYWATSEWSAREIEEAHHIANKLNLIAPIAEQCKHHMFHRDRPEKEYAPLYKKYHLGTTTFSSLAGGLLTGKYNDGVPDGTRFANHSSFFKDTIENLKSPEGKAQIAKVKELTVLAEQELGTTVSALALAWVAKNPNTSTVILGASRPEQILENLKAIEVLPKLTPEVMEKIEKILENKPDAPPTYGRPFLDRFGRL
ncbi:hypothetical protein CVT26_004779 [Gymnopilus dilepis]|uniref:NADP-dependent oxidoreductase domain-containing protein n=1 Tax=Gymnopilus dilepis TaxID=231916 RepID=A0A409XZL5_9AGAR|nr:hypothetical protein CVT26_004779 [Gymnopilus dilepis]